MNQFKNAALAVFEEVTLLRRDFHRHPEIGRNELRTAKIIREKLAEYGVDRIESPVPTAVIAYINGGLGEGKCVALRADIDALPVSEDSGLPFSSEIPNMMHACGHDIHAAMLLGVAKILCAARNKFAGTVKLIFQHSEDTLPGGAKELTELGIMDDVDAIFGMHVFPVESDAGKVAVKSGALTTSVDMYAVTISGPGGHGSAPHTTADPVLAASQMIVALQQIVSRRIDPLETAIISIGVINGGDAVNIIPAKVEFSGVSRAYSDSARETVNKQFFEIARGIEAISGCKVEIDHYEGYPSTENDPELTDILRSVVKETLGETALIELPTPMGFSEDFSYYTKMTGKPGAYVMLYTGTVGEHAPLHSPKLAFSEDSMPAGMATLASAAVAYLNR